MEHTTLASLQAASTSGVNPFEALLGHLASTLYPTPSHGFEARLWTLSALSGVHIIVSIVFMIVSMPKGRFYFFKVVKRSEGSFVAMNPLFELMLETLSGGLIIYSCAMYYRAYIRRGDLSSIVPLHALTWVPLWSAYWSHIIANIQALSIMPAKTIVRPYLLTWLAYGVPFVIFVPVVTLAGIAWHQWLHILDLIHALQTNLRQGDALYQTDPASAIAYLQTLTPQLQSLSQSEDRLALYAKAISVTWVIKLVVALVGTYFSVAMLKHISATLAYHTRGNTQRVTVPDEMVTLDVSRSEFKSQHLEPGRGIASMIQRDAERATRIQRLTGLKWAIAVLSIVGTIVCTVSLVAALITAIRPAETLDRWPVNEYVSLGISWAYIILIIPARIAQITQHLLQSKRQKAQVTQVNGSEDDCDKDASTMKGSADSLGLKLELPTQAINARAAKPSSDLWQPPSGSDGVVRTPDD
ncbi:uncharacterized protein L969DRAFT_45472 [Mixia osmundae IAM 14324]|uniref:Uncharacterized protein n=1 Tax=Mixia osmundae (strain CBS 9802 / IAM 14324 / JCM 22182 / KY 12970) TaxID=764103 RepID=G7DTQ9_MIXOS|nr:uncharacterized protein L969DRAFT_45472 [Mixia osmundae IAM 14324]KEI41684.1 hypothetical protein L969DRAFT_45472 [Mixia osmundae IAM 14324]GAA93969.1 hypothetical protein E5Q_00615 [Mixia osmundae IAM 14324]